MAFILAVTGSAVGLGNIWKFPYIVGENGGGAFVLVYLICVVAIGMPVMMSEILIGRRGRRNPVQVGAISPDETGDAVHQGDDRGPQNRRTGLRQHGIQQDGRHPASRFSTAHDL